MANQHKHPVRGLRGIDSDLWADFEAAVQADGTDRSADLRRYMEWRVGRPGAEPPTRVADKLVEPPA